MRVWHNNKSYVITGFWEFLLPIFKDIKASCEDCHRFGRHLWAILVNFPFSPTHPPPLPPPRNEPINSWLIMNSRIDDWLIKDRRWDRFKRRWQLRSVIERPMFAAHPLATALSGRSVIAAAAARWRHPTRGAQFEPEFESEEVVGRQTQRRCRQEDANAQCVSHRFVNWFTSLICS